MGTTPSKGKTSNEGASSDSETPAGSKVVECQEGSSVFQAGGHGRLSKAPEQDGAIRKVANDAEIIFYQTLNGNDPKLVAIPDHIRSFFPKFYGVSEKMYIIPFLDVVGGNDGTEYVVMQDLTHGVKRACIMDIKMGTKTFTNDSNFVKQWMLEHKDHKTTTATLGFRVTGLRSFKRTSNEYDVKGKPWGMALTPDDITENLVTFFHDGEKVRSDVIQKYIDRLEILLPWYSEQNIIKIYSSSLLFVYDSDGDVDMADVHMIDFAHVKRIEDPNGRDHGYVAGLRNLIDIFKKMLETHPSSTTNSHDPKSTRLDIPSEDRSQKKKKRKSQPAMADSSEPSASSNGTDEKLKTPSKPPRSPRSTTEPKSPGDVDHPAAESTTPNGSKPKRKSAKRPKTARDSNNRVESTSEESNAALAHSE